jgi:hypothetical protein
MRLKMKKNPQGRPAKDRGPTWNKILDFYSKGQDSPPLTCLAYRLGVSEQNVKLWLNDGIPEKFVCRITGEVDGLRLADVVKISTVYPRLMNGDDA